MDVWWRERDEGGWAQGHFDGESRVSSLGGRGPWAESKRALHCKRGYNERESTKKNVQDPIVNGRVQARRIGLAFQRIMISLSMRVDVFGWTVFHKLNS